MPNRGGNMPRNETGTATVIDTNERGLCLQFEGQEPHWYNYSKYADARPEPPPETGDLVDVTYTGDWLRSVVITGKALTGAKKKAPRAARGAPKDRSEPIDRSVCLKAAIDTARIIDLSPLTAKDLLSLAEYYLTWLHGTPVDDLPEGPF